MLDSDSPRRPVLSSLLSSRGLNAPYVQLETSEAKLLLAEHYGISGESTRFATEKDDTFLVRPAIGAPVVLKVANPAETVEEIDFQIEMLRHIARVAPVVPVPRVVATRNGYTHSFYVAQNGAPRIARVVSYIEGTPLSNTESSPNQREEIGRVLAELRHATAEFSHAGDRRELAWDVRHLSRFTALLSEVDNDQRRRKLESAIARFIENTEDLPRLRSQVLHNDFSKSNIVVDHATPQFVRGIIDFGDSVHTAIAIDVSTALLNQLPAMPVGDIFASGRDVLRGYLRYADLNERERAMIPHLVMGRVVARALLTTWRAKLFPENAEYILRNTKQGWWQLDWFLDRTPAEVEESLLAPPLSVHRMARQDSKSMSNGVAGRRRGKMVKGFDPGTLGSLEPESRRLIERRAKLLGPAYRLFYDRPVEFRRGKGVFLYDADGLDYLDAYNNVAAVGHGHPKVAAAIAEQFTTLCTHTRYLQQGILDYAEELIPTFGGKIRHLMLTCSGSEANDLAVRIAKYRTGRSGIIVTAEAYHGNTDLTAGFSPSLGENSQLDMRVRCVDAPDSYRGDPNALGERMAAQAAAHIADLERRGDGLAAFVVDSFFASDGIYTDPAAVLQPVANVVRKAGGLFIADEVQCGLGRSGTHLWGFQRHGIEPDIVSMGKPMGNGFPVAGLAVTPEAVADFGHDMRYFNTFGGNTVAVAAARATFEVLREQDILSNVDRTGRAIRAEIGALAAKHALIGDVRGAGLYTGVEIVRDRESRTPDPAAARAVVNRMRDERVLISATGPSANVLKIRPPLVFSEGNIDRLITALDTALSFAPRVG